MSKSPEALSPCASKMSASLDVEDPVVDLKVRKRFQIIATMAAVLCPFIIGMAFGYTSSALTGMYSSIVGLHVLEENPTSMTSFYVSFVNFGAIFGTIIGFFVMDRVGRKRMSIMTGPIFICGWLLQAFVSNYYLLDLSRFIVGIGVGIGTMTIPVYISEITSPRLRGTLAAINSLMCSTGILTVFILGELMVVEDKSKDKYVSQWRHMAIAVSVFSVLWLLAALWMPESPRWLLMVGKKEEAMASLSYLRGGEDRCQVEFREMQVIKKEDGEFWPTVFKWKKVLLIDYGLMVIQQFVGINAFYFYFDRIFTIPHAGLIVMILQLVMGVVTSSLMDIAGRRMLLMLSTIGSTVGLAMVTIFFFLQDSNQHLNWIGTVGSLIYIAFFCMGIGPIPWMLMGELFPARIRGPAAAVAVGQNYFYGSVVTFLVPLFSRQVVFLIFTCVGIVGVAFIYFLVPETKNKSLEEIQAELRITDSAN